MSYAKQFRVEPGSKIDLDRVEKIRQAIPMGGQGRPE